MKNHRAHGITLIEVLIALVLIVLVAVIVYALVFSAGRHIATHTTAADLDNQCRMILAEVTKDLRNTPATRCTLGTANMTSVAGWWVSDTVTLQPVNTELDATSTQSSSTTYNPFTGAIATSATVVWSSTLLESTVDGANNVVGPGSNDGLADEREIVRTQTIVNAGTRRASTRGTSRFPVATNLATASGATGAPSAPVFAPPVVTANGQGFVSAPPALAFAIQSTSNLPDVTLPHITVTVTLQGVDAGGRLITRSATTTVVMQN
jgi:Tfp pilus assembly protein PilV